MTPETFTRKFASHLHYFKLVVELHSLTAVSLAADISQSRLSRIITELETETGQELLIRRRNDGCTPTAAGKGLYDLIITFQSNFNEYFPTNFDFKTDHYKIVIGANSYARAVVWPQFISSLYLYSPNGHFELEPVESLQIPDRCEIILTSRELPEPYKSWPLIEDSLVVVKNAASQEFDRIVYGPDRDLNQRITETLGVCSTPIQCNCFYSLLETVAGISAGSVVPSQLLESDIRLSTFPVLCEPVAGEYQIFISVRESLLEHPKVSQILKYIRKCFPAQNP